MMRGFDSIESMNAEELLVKRRRGSKKYLFIFAFVCAIFFIVGVLIGYFAHPDNDNSGADVSPSTDGDSFDSTKFILDNIDKQNIRETLSQYSSQPRLAGTVLGDELAKKIESEWNANGLDEVHLASYDILLSFPNKSNPNVIQIINTTNDQVQFESHKYEVPLMSHENNSHVLPPFNAYSPPGDVTGDVVYVNYARIEDFEALVNMSVNVSGKIVIARYGQIFRGDKVRNAERFNAVAVILYSDPKDVNNNSQANIMYPNSWWLPPSGIQRGTVATVDGDPATPQYPSTDYAYRLPTDKVNMNLPKIPCQPIGYNDAEKILSMMGGQAAPDDWQGNLNFTYRMGPGFLDQNDTKVRVKVNNYREVSTVHNVIGYITGSEEPDRYVLLGNHHDAWVFGAVDPLSGSAALTEITRVFGQLLSKGHRPRRTVVFCSWDAEEYGLMGSVEWVEDHLNLLHHRGVAYLNMDFAVVGNYTLAVGTSPLLQDAIYDAAKQVPSPIDGAGKTLYDLWKARPSKAIPQSASEPIVSYSLGSGSDMAAFYERAGVSCVDMWMTYNEVEQPLFSYPLYHSSYETFFSYDNFIDPGFIFTNTIAQFIAVLASNLANSELLPISVQRYSTAVSKFHQTLVDKFKERWKEQGVNIDAFGSAVQNFTDATKTFQDMLNADKNKIVKNPLNLRRVNDQLIQLERAFLDPEGLPGRPSQKHVIFAPSQFDCYVDNSFPGIVETMFEIDHGKDQWELLKQQVFVATYIIQSASSSLEDIGL